MKPQISTEDQTARAYLFAIEQEDRALHEARKALDHAIIAWQLALTKYKSVRDLFVERYGIDPYTVNWSVLGINPPPTEGRYRFLDMNISEAVKQVLLVADEPLDLDEIEQNLKAGGRHVPDARTVNASLMTLVRGGDVAQTDSGKYYIAEEPKESDPEEVPFE